MSSGYSVQLVVLSIVIACVASYAALFLAGHVARTRARFGWLVGAACAMGMGIWSMHFIAMLAFRLPVTVGYDVPLLLLSLLIAAVASGIGLQVAGHAEPRIGRILLTGPVMGLAIAGMHYTGMASMRLPALQHYDPLLVGASVAIAVAASYAAIVLFLRFRFDRTRRGAWLKILSAVVMGHAVAGMHYTAMAAVHFEHAPMRATGLVLPADQLAMAIAVSTLVILALVVAGTMLDRWAETHARIRLSEERFRAMVDAIQDHAIFTLDADGIIDSWNRGAERLIGRTASESVGQPLRVLYPASSQTEAARELQAARDLGRYEADAASIVKRGETRRVNVTTTAMRDAEGSVIGFARILRDVTDRIRAEEELKRSEAQLRQAQKMEAVGQLAGGVAHDFNNMLTAIRGHADLLREDFAPGTEVHAGLSEIANAADRSAALTRQLLAFSRKQMMQPKPVNPNDSVVELETMLRRVVVAGVDLVMELSPDVGQIVVDPAQLQQVLLNLALNARDAMPAGGQIVIRSGNVTLTEGFCKQHPGSVPGAHVVLSVTDTGVGMAPEIQPHVFEPFFTTKPLGAGTGLGLSTVYGIVKQSGGYVTFESQPERGTTFSVYFPRTSAQSHAAVPRAHEKAVAPPPPAPPVRETVLLVDDEVGVRQMLATLLERHGYRVLPAADGEDALQVSARHEGAIDLMITDMMMPEMDGRQLSERLATLRPSMRVLFISGYTSGDIIERGLLDSRMWFIQKPFTMADLLAKVQSTLATPLAHAG